MKRNSALPGGPTAMRSVCPRSTKRNVNAAITASANAIASSDENDVSTRNDRRNVRRNGCIIDLSSGPCQPDWFIQQTWELLTVCKADRTPLAYVGLGSSASIALRTRVRLSPDSRH